MGSTILIYSDIIPFSASCIIKNILLGEACVGAQCFRVKIRSEMLLQSHRGKPCERIIEILPALPDNWSGGKITGVRARGDFTFDITWKNGVLDTAEITSGKDNVLRIKPNVRTKNICSDKKHEVVDGVLCFEMSQNEKIIIKNA